MLLAREKRKRPSTSHYCFSCLKKMSNERSAFAETLLTLLNLDFMHLTFLEPSFRNCFQNGVLCWGIQGLIQNSMCETKPTVADLLCCRDLEKFVSVPALPLQICRLFNLSYQFPSEKLPIPALWPVPSATKYAPSTRRGNWFIVANLPEPISAAGAVHCHQKSWDEWLLETFSALLDLLRMRFRWVNTGLDHPTSCKHGFKLKDCNSDIATF